MENEKRKIAIVDIEPGVSSGLFMSLESAKFPGLFYWRNDAIQTKETVCLSRMS